MDIPNCWEFLEIAPTDDLKLIRRAYAQKLKAIDVQADAKAFIALRSAYEAAYDAVSSVRFQLPEADAGPVAAKRPWQAEMDAIDSLLWSDRSRESIHDPLSAQTGRLIEYSRACDLDRAMEIELWIAEAIVAGIPRSNGMLAPAIAGFDWEARIEGHDCPDAIRIAVERHEDAAYLRRLQALNPHYRLAWAALTEGVADFEALHVASVATLLGIVQHQRPGLTYDIDTDRFRDWMAALENHRRLEILNKLPAAVHEEDIEADDSSIVRELAYLSASMAIYCVTIYSYLAGGGFFITLLILSIVASVFVIIALESRAKRRRRRDARAYRG